MAAIPLAHPEVAGWVLGTVDPHDAEWFAGQLPSCPGLSEAMAGSRGPVGSACLRWRINGLEDELHFCLDGSAGNLDPVVE